MNKLVLTENEIHKVQTLTTNSMEYIDDVLNDRLMEEIEKEFPDFNEDQLNDALCVARDYYFNS